MGPTLSKIKQHIKQLVVKEKTSVFKNSAAVG
jgi:hypothetical protein